MNYDYDWDPEYERKRLSNLLNMTYFNRKEKDFIMTLFERKNLRKSNKSYHAILDRLHHLDDLIYYKSQEFSPTTLENLHHFFKSY